MPIKFSVISVVLDDLKGLKETKKSISCQSHADFEWIIQDGGSGAEMLMYLESMVDGVKWVSEKDSGIYDAMNHGVSKSTGDFVVFMNAGDTFHDTETLARVAKVLGDEQAADVLFGGASLSFCDKRRTVYRPPRLAENSLWHGLPAIHQATFYRKKLLDASPFDLQYRLCGDYYLAATLIRNGARLTYLNEPLATFEVGGQSYKNRRNLFLEPYRIQRDVLGLPLHYRLASVAKRFISTVGFVILSQPFFINKNDSRG